MTVNGNGQFLATPTISSGVVLVAASGVLFQALARTLEEEIRDCETVVCTNVLAPDPAVRTPRLILLHAQADTNPGTVVDAWRESYPHAAIAIVVDDLQKLQPPCKDLFERQKVQGILPLTLKLEIWLAAVSLLLSGGDYLPIADRRDSPFLAARPRSGPPGLPAAHHSQQRPPASAALPALRSLTNRERQILELLSEGHQNKVIAHKMSLSEHTVKVHVHNLLSKLRVSNRTQAAAAFRGGLTDLVRANALARARGIHETAATHPN